MPDDAVKSPPDPHVTPAADARHMMRIAGRVALATLDRASGYPYASLVAMATEPDGAPILLLSRLALHTQNLEADSRASLLVDTGVRRGDPLAAGRVTLMGRLRPADSNAAERRFLAAHPSAAGYASFADFRFFALQLECAHYVGGFGRISSLAAADLLLDVSGAAALITAEPELVAAINQNQSAKVAELGARLSGGHVGPWRVTGLDPAGCDLVLADERLRCTFSAPVTDIGEARRALSELLEPG